MRLKALFSGLAVAVAAAVALAAPARALTPADQLVIGMSIANVLSMDPGAASSREADMIRSNLYDMLVELDPTDPSRTMPGLATEWEVSEDGRLITFTLREGVTFQSGNPVTAEDAAWSLHRVLKLNLGAASSWRTYGFTADNVEQYIRAVDSSTVEVELPAPTDPTLLLFSMADPSAAVVDRQTVLQHERNGDFGNAWLTTNSAGSGAFRLRDWQANSLILLERHDGYWHGPARMARVIIRHMPESQTQRLMLERGDIDIGANLSVPDIRALEDRDDVVVQLTREGGFYYLAVSLAEPVFQDPRVRLAIRHLIDYEGINAAIMPNYGVLHRRPIRGDLPATLPDPGYAFDPELARSLLAEAGYPNGFDTTIRVLSDTPFINIATSVQNTLAEGGIRAEIISGGGSVVYDRMRERNFDLAVGRGGITLPHPDAMASIVYNPDNSREAALYSQHSWRTSSYNPGINLLIEAARAATDVELRNTYYEDAQRLYHALVPAWQPISAVVNAVAYRADVEGFRIHPTRTTRMAGVSKAR